MNQRLDARNHPELQDILGGDDLGEDHEHDGSQDEIDHGAKLFGPAPASGNGTGPRERKRTGQEAAGTTRKEETDGVRVLREVDKGRTCPAGGVGTRATGSEAVPQPGREVPGSQEDAERDPKRGERFGKTFEWLEEEGEWQTLSRAEHKLLGSLLIRVSRTERGWIHRGECFPKIETLMTKTGLSERSLRLGLAALRRKHLVSVRKTKNPRGRWYNVYKVLSHLEYRAIKTGRSGA